MWSKSQEALNYIQSQLRKVHSGMDAIIARRFHSPCAIASHEWEPSQSLDNDVVTRNDEGAISMRSMEENMKYNDSLTSNVKEETNGLVESRVARSLSKKLIDNSPKASMYFDNSDGSLRKYIIYDDSKLGLEDPVLDSLLRRIDQDRMIDEDVPFMNDESRSGRSKEAGRQRRTMLKILKSVPEMNPEDTVNIINSEIIM